MAEPAVFAALGDATRWSLVLRLAGGASLSIAALAGDTRLTRQAVTKHLRVLEQAGVVTAARTGRETRYALCGRTLAHAAADLSAVARQWDDALGRLKALVERG